MYETKQKRFSQQRTDSFVTTVDYTPSIGPLTSQNTNLKLSTKYI